MPRLFTPIPLQVSSIATRPWWRPPSASPGTRGRSAISLIEICIAALILSVALLPAIGVFQHNSEQTRANKNRTFAAALAASVIERYRRAKPSELNNFKDAASIEGMIKTAMDAKDVSGASEPALIDSDPLLKIVDTPPAAVAAAGAFDSEREFAGSVAKRFRRFVAFDQSAASGSSSTRFAGQLICSVVWIETSGINRAVRYTVGSVVGDTTFPLGSEQFQ